MKRSIVALSLVGFACLLAASRPGEREGKPIFGISGSYSAVMKPRVEVIASAERFAEVWKEHMGDKIEKTAHHFDVIPDVDFSRCMVVAMFSGKTVNSAGWRVVSTLQRDDHTVIRYDETRFQSMSANGPDRGFESAGYGFAVIDRTTRPIILEENVQTLIDGGPVWKERQRVPALTPAPQRGN